MTGYTVHTGSNEDFSSGWDRIFGDGASQSDSGTKKKRKKTAKKADSAKQGTSKKAKRKR